MQRTNESRRLALIIVSALVVLLASSALRVQGQTVFGRISGTVKDPNAAAVPNAMVTITNLATNLVRTTTTDSDGFYTVTNLPVGNYSVEAEQGGFKKAAQSGISVVADARLTVDITLEPGQVTETVQITTGAGETVNTTSGEVGRLVDQRQIQNLALNGRNYMQLVTLIPGAVILDEDQLALTTSLSISQAAVNGNRPNYNSLTVDGGFNMDSGSNNSQINNVGIDFIQEVKIQTSNFSAEYGRNAGASVNVVTRGGGNSYHGSVFEFIRNDKLRGPDGIIGTADDGALRDPSKPASTCVAPVFNTDGSIKTAAIRTGCFAGNIIPAGLLTADGKAIASVYSAMEKLAAAYSDTATANNATFQQPNPLNYREDNIRLDYRFNEKHSIYGRYLHDHYDLIDPYGTFITSQLPTIPTNRLRPGSSYQVSYTWLISPTLINEAKINVSYNGQRIPPVGEFWKRATYNFAYPQLFSGGRFDNGIPNTTITNFASFNGPSGSLLSPTTDIATSDNFTLIHGKHSIKMGIVVVRNRKDQNSRPDSYNGRITFSTNGNPNSTGDPVADALMGNFQFQTKSGVRRALLPFWADLHAGEQYGEL